MQLCEPRCFSGYAGESLDSGHEGASFSYWTNCATNQTSSRNPMANHSPKTSYQMRVISTPPCTTTTWCTGNGNLSDKQYSVVCSLVGSTLECLNLYHVGYCLPTRARKFGLWLWNCLVVLHHVPSIAEPMAISVHHSIPSGLICKRTRHQYWQDLSSEFVTAQPRDGRYQFEQTITVSSSYLFAL
ncbi:hypothetical protein K470DRAFT_259282 [Piedraia hortae CBS 480.64]|uniref:Uncharacterized protein n=1 Tax=Piedraia hortae CBS 480.64 TaxID=1314780 RepID=A0A6A7BUW9_9PEZI|nr:hypothetical protein K470DRAFT_259282 [Piedraia hortae CBS 480.64]